MCEEKISEDQRKIMRQIRGVIRASKVQIGQTEDALEKAKAYGAWEGYLQAFYFCRLINRNEYESFHKEMMSFRNGTEKMKKALE